MLPANALLTSVVPLFSAAGYSANTSTWLPAGTFLLPDGGAQRPDGGAQGNPDGGTFFPSYVAVPGVRLETWNPLTGDRVLLAQNTVSTRLADGGFVRDGAVPVSATLADVTVSMAQQPDGGAIDGGNSALLQRLITDNAMQFQVTTHSGPMMTGAAPLPAELATDSVEVRVRYLVP